MDAGCRVRALVAVLAAPWLIAGCQSTGAVSPPQSGALVLESELVEVVDGDTLAITSPRGQRQRVRIIGIDTPESARDGQPAQCWAREATDALRELIEQADQVTLAPDSVVGDRDRYGRLLRLVFVDGTDVGEQLLADGHARRFAAIADDSRVTDRYRRVERQARSGGVGLWGRCASSG